MSPSHASLETELASLPQLRTLSREELHRIARVAARVQEPKGEILTKEGEQGHELMILLEGTVEVRHDDEVIATLGRGDIFGEMALLAANARRTATAVATSRVTIAFVARHDVVHLMEDVPALAACVRKAAEEHRESSEHS